MMKEYKKPESVMVYLEEGACVIATSPNNEVGDKIQLSKERGTVDFAAEDNDFEF